MVRIVLRCVTLLWVGVVLGQANAATALTQLAQADDLPAIVAAVPRDDAAVRAEITAAAIELSRLEVNRDFAELYSRLHPDSRARIPFPAFVGWYEALFDGKTTAGLTVLEIKIIDWTWGVSGKTYPATAEVRVVQPYWVAGARSEVENVFHLVEDQGIWTWFFGGSQAYIEEQIARYAPYAVGEAGIETACGAADPQMEATFYCVPDQTIYYSTDFRSTDFREMVETQIGDYGWGVVIAHEWGHHVQLILGGDLVGALNQVGNVVQIQLEQQADCLAGAYIQSAERGGYGAAPRASGPEGAPKDFSGTRPGYAPRVRTPGTLWVRTRGLIRARRGRPDAMPPRFLGFGITSSVACDACDVMTTGDGSSQPGGNHLAYTDGSRSRTRHDDQPVPEGLADQRLESLSAAARGRARAAGHRR